MASLGDYTLAEGQKLEPAGNISGYVESLEVKPIRSFLAVVAWKLPRKPETGRSIMWPTMSRLFGAVITDSSFRTWSVARHGLTCGEALQEKITGFDVRNINKIFFCGHKPGVTQEALKTEILSALESIPNELNKKFEYVATNEQPFNIKFTGIVKRVCWWMTR